MNNELTESVLKQSENLHTAIDMVLDKSAELHKEQQRSKQLYEMCENLWQTLVSVRVNYYYKLSTSEIEQIANVLTNNNPSKLNPND